MKDQGRRSSLSGAWICSPTGLPVGALSRSRPSNESSAVTHGLLLIWANVIFCCSIRELSATSATYWGCRFMIHGHHCQ